MKRDSYSTIGRRIAGLASGQAEIAAILQVTQQTVSKKLRGECAITVAELMRLQRRYGCRFAYFFGEDDCRERLPVPIADFAVHLARSVHDMRAHPTAYGRSTDPAVRVRDVPPRVGALTLAAESGDRPRAADLCTEVAAACLLLAEAIRGS